MYDYTYTLDPPINPPPVNKRLGYRTPRSILLPPYLLQNQYWIDYANGIDSVFQHMVDQPIDTLQNIRNMWVTNPDMERYLMNMTHTDGKLVPFSMWSQPERSLLIKQVNNLGMRLQDSSIVPDESYLAIARFVGQYWFAKGTKAFIEFINFCLKTDLDVTRLWTEDYDTFLNDGSPGIGTPIWEGGTWYPTSHVSILAKGGLENIDPDTLVAFFYEIANYNLVLESIEAVFDMPIVDDPTRGDNTAQIVAVGLFANNSLVISNVTAYGVDGPPQITTVQGLPTSVYTTAPLGSNFSTMYLLAQPSAWIADPDGDLIPLYGERSQSPTVDTFIPTTLQGGVSTTTPDDPAGYTLIYGPANLVPIPGSRSLARIPSFSTTPVLRTGNVNQVTSRILGASRGFLLVNPKGFKPLYGNTSQIVPYW